MNRIFCFSKHPGQIVALKDSKTNKREMKANYERSHEIKYTRQTHLILRAIQYEYCYILSPLLPTIRLNYCSNIHICLKRQTKLAFTFWRE
jgi:hypothetical protein